MEFIFRPKVNTFNPDSVSIELTVITGSMKIKLGNMRMNRDSWSHLSFILQGSVYNAGEASITVEDILDLGKTNDQSSRKKSS